MLHILISAYILPISQDQVPFCLSYDLLLPWSPQCNKVCVRKLQFQCCRIWYHFLIHHLFNKTIDGFKDT